MPVRDYCTLNPISIRAHESVRDAAKSLEQAHVGCLVVIDDKRRPIGVVTDRDIALRAMRLSLDPDSTPVSSIMSDEVSWARADAPLSMALRRMRQDGVRRIPVTEDNGQLCGLLAWDDAIQVVADELQSAAAVARAQRPDSSQAS